METYRDLTAAVARRQPQMLKMIAAAGWPRVPYGRPGGRESLRHPGRGVDQSQRGQEPGAANKSRPGTC